MRRSLSVLLSLGLLFTSCGDDDSAPPDGTGTPPSDTAAPLGLIPGDMPATMTEVAAIFDALPGQVEGRTREPSVYGFEALYGSNVLVAMEVDPGTAGDSMALFREEAGAVVETMEDDPSQPLLWMLGRFDDAGGEMTVHMATWCKPQGTWAFTVNAETAEMRDALVTAFVDTAHAVAQGEPVEPSADLASLEALREAIPSETDLAALIGVEELTLDVAGGPGVTDWMFEHVQTPGLVGGYAGGFRSTSGLAGNGSLSISLFETEADASTMVENLPEDETDEMVQSTFTVTEVLTGGRGLVMNPEPGSYFTDLVGYEGRVLIHVLVFHGPDDDAVDETLAIAAAVAAALGGSA